MASWLKFLLSFWEFGKMKNYTIFNILNNSQKGQKDKRHIAKLHQWEIIKYSLCPK